MRRDSTGRLSAALLVLARRGEPRLLRSRPVTRGLDVVLTALTCLLLRRIFFFISFGSRFRPGGDERAVRRAHWGVGDQGESDFVSFGSRFRPAVMNAQYGAARRVPEIKAVQHAQYGGLVECRIKAGPIVSLSESGSGRTR